MWRTAERGMKQEVLVEVVVSDGIQRRRWVVRMTTPDLSWGKVGVSSDKRSTAERREHSTSPGFKTGRPLAVNSADGRKAPAMVNTR